MLSLHIETGYRKHCESPFDTLPTLFTYHNETINIWSHIFGCIFTLYYINYNNNQSQNIALLIYFFCYASSIIFHLFLNTNYYLLTLKIDNLGTLFVIIYNSITVNYAISKEVSPELLFLCAISLWHSLTRGLFLDLFNISINIIIATYWAHNFLLINPKNDFDNIIIFEYAIYAIAVAIWYFKIPECFWPGRFDYIGNSHNIFHIMIVYANYCHYLLLAKLYHA